MQKMSHLNLQPLAFCAYKGGDGSAKLSDAADQKGTRYGVPNRDQIRGCPRNCKR